MADKALRKALETGINPPDNSPIFVDSSDEDSSDDGIYTYDEHQKKMQKKRRKAY